ncbi:MAG: ATP-binding protein [Chloroherpetonaceae bacterium]|nr:ATP-binding protein [Chthonomonadaceae bacterium]MDW8208041.1 ATP-binding protein [Chloroherpetonaceae bacterium]
MAMVTTDEFEVLRQQIQRLKKELAEVKQRNAELERVRSSAAPEVGELPVAISEFEETLRRLVQRTAMIVQAEKCVIMVRDRETGDLVARPPAFGMTDEELREFRISPDRGISGAVFQSTAAGIFHDAATDERAVAENLVRFRIRNGVSVPLLIEKRDEENRIVDRITVGVLHCFNKRYGGEFIEEDVRLLERLSRNAAAVIANAQMFQEVVEEKQKLVHTLESLTAGLIFLNQRGRIGQMNTQARAMFAVPEDFNPIGRPIEEVVRHEECLKLLHRKLEELCHPQKEEEVGGIRQPDEITVHDKDDVEYIYQVHATSVTDDNGNPLGTVFLFTDITDLRHVERMKTEFVSIVSHELRTPLTPMKGFVRTLLDDENEEWYTREDRREFYKIIEENVDRLGRLIDDLLNVSRIERMGAAGLDMKWEEVDLRKAVEDVATVQRARTNKHTIVVDFDPETIVVETDPDKIQNILHNIISNAIKYSPDGGEIRIIGRLEPATETEPESVLVGVKDQGIGMTEHDLKAVGNKFYRTAQSKSIGGTGIGLFLVINLLKAHRGRLWPESEGLGKGSTFWFRFPVRQPRDENGNILPLTMDLKE